MLRMTSQSESIARKAAELAKIPVASKLTPSFHAADDFAK